MKKQIQLLLMVVMMAFVSCATVKQSNNEPRDGSSFEKAIVVKSIAQEYAYVKTVCPECQLQAQSLVFNKKKPYDLLIFKKSNGEEVVYYFDVSRFYGKGF